MKIIKPGTRETRNFQLDRAHLDVTARTVGLKFSSETPVERFFGTEILDHSPGSVRMDRLVSGGPLLVDHNNTVAATIGVIESVTIDPDRAGRAIVRFGKSAVAEEIYQNVKDGIIRNASVGYIINRVEEVSSGIFRVMDWTPIEISLVGVPADPTTQIGRSIEKESPLKEDIRMTIKKTSSEAPAPESAAPDNKEAIKRAVDALNRRNTDIISIGEDHADIGGMQLAAEAIRKDQTVTEFQSIILAARKKGTPHISYGSSARATDNAAKDQKRGFANLGDFCLSVRNNSIGRGVDDRLTRAASTFASEGVGPDGGFAVPPEFAAGIASLALGEESLLSMTANLPVSGSSMTYAKDEGTPWSSTGVTATWEGEAGTITQSNPNFEKDRLELKSLKVLVPATEELLADSTAMSAHITRTMGEKVDWKVQDAIIQGTGAGMPLGILASGALVSQAKESAQTATTLVAGNVAKMLGRIINGTNTQQAWLMNPDVFQQVITMSLNSNPVWTSPNEGFKSAPNGFLLGRRIILTDACKTLGDKGDIILANMAGYRSITKAGGLEFATSMHLYFDQNMVAFRLIFRMDGAPMLSAPVTPPNSAIKRSHFVALDARA